MEIKLIVLIVLNVVYVVHGVIPSDCTQGVNCMLPECFCATFDHPNRTAKFPQIVYFAIDDALTVTVDKPYQRLFNDSRTNPNGCPITFSLFVQDQYTSYNLVENYSQRGHEIGCHGVNHTNVDTASKLRFEAGLQKENVITKGHVSRNQVVGWRSPNLKTAGDAQPDVLKELNYTYDISLTYPRQADNRVPFPFTLDYGYPYSCSIPPCPDLQSSHPGFWEVPVFSLRNPETGYECAYVDSCRPSSEAAALNYLWSNFLQVFNDNRAPFGLSMHGAWFLYSDDYFNAADTFIKKLLEMDDVYIVSVEKTLDWMRNPVEISDIQEKLPSWGCQNPTQATAVQ